MNDQHVVALAAASLLSLSCGDNNPVASVLPNEAAISGQCGGHPDWANSEYVLPYPAGIAYEVVQGNCSPSTAHWNSHQIGTPWTFAYDFLMPVGSPIAAVRAGTVVFVREQNTDIDKGLENGNAVVIEHEDGTYAGYGHLTHNGALVETGQEVAQGQVIGLSGNSGESVIPHLHFQVSPCRVMESCESLPITFRNTKPHPNGLLVGEVYVALPE